MLNKASGIALIIIYYVPSMLGNYSMNNNMLCALYVCTTVSALQESIIQRPSCDFFSRGRLHISINSGPG